jgi:hypothetical protein
MAATPLTLEAADELASKLVNQFNLVGVEGCEEADGVFTYFFESGHWAEVSVAEHGGLTYRLHQPEEE